jgi:uncharacterized membrane protein
MKRLAPAFALAIGFATTTSAAHAGLTLCNRTSYVLYAATGALTLPDIAVKGWTRLIPGACAEAIKGDLTAQQYFLYAKTSRAHSGTPRAWSGATQLCAKDKDFALRLPFNARCPADGYELNFAEVATRHKRAWTTTFHDSPDLPTLPAAERAGLKRLIGDTGSKNAVTDKQVGDALKAFKARLHLAANAPTAALFDALETEAMKSAAPSGYTLCNDTGGDVFAAIGQQMVAQSGLVFVARGWWTVAGGVCAQLMTDSLAGKKIWLRVERAKGAVLVQGPAKFCITNIEFDIQGRDRCAARGLTEAGFAETHSGPAPSFTAHVTAGGLAGK